MPNKKEKSLARLKISYFLISDSYEYAKTSPDSQQLAARVADLERLREEFLSEYVDLTSSEEVKDDVEELLVNFNTKYYELRAMVHRPPADHSGSQGASTTSITLPPVNVPVFRGKTEDWPSFFSLFSSVISSDKKLSDTHKLYYLHSLLRDEPQQLIKHLAISGENYNIALELLKRRYDNKRLLIDTNLRSIWALFARGNLREFTNKVLEYTESLKSLGFISVQSDYIFVHILLAKLDQEVRNRYEQLIGDNTNSLPTLSHFVNFLETQSRISEMGSSTNNTSKRAVCNILSGTGYTSARSNACAFCKKAHLIYGCEEFKKLSIKERRDFVKRARLCYCCLRSHVAANCTSDSKCRICNKQTHHTYLHIDEVLPNSKNNREEQSRDVLFNHTTEQYISLLGTIQLQVKADNGKYLNCRALVDSGSQTTLITEECANMLNLKRKKSKIVLSALGGERSINNKGAVHLILKSRFSHSEILGADALVVLKITGKLPTVRLNSNIVSHFKNIELADPQFFIPEKVDILLGCNEFANILCGNVLRVGQHLPRAMQTTFGYVLMGDNRNNANSDDKTESTQANTVLHITTDDDRLTEFFELEDIPQPPISSYENEQCEEFFKQTVSRETDSKFCVRLPFKKNAPMLGDSRRLALKRFFGMEKRLQNDTNLKFKYVDFMREYINLGHMSLFTGTLPPPERHYFTPHHGIFKSGTSKLRVVFDASAKTLSGYSLNDCLHSGVKLQNNISSILISFRLHKYVFSTDIVKMFRNIWVHPDDRTYQLILWRENPEQPLLSYQLHTVTYGQSSSPYISIRCIQQLAHEYMEKLPTAANTILKCFYVDDLLTGASTLEEAIALRDGIVTIMQSAGLELGKWLSNHPKILTGIPDESLEIPRSLEPSEACPTKLLGVKWDNVNDRFTFDVKISSDEHTTKRKILSAIAGIFDPCGLLTPFVFKAKTVMQQLWLANIGWDDQVPSNILSEWRKIVSDISVLKDCRVDRFVFSPGEENSESEITLHGFSDASQAGFACCVYLRVINGDNITVNLIAAKSRVAPTRKQLTIPRLELCGVVLLANLIEHVMDAISGIINISKIYGWCDSTIALSWVKTAPNLLQMYEANRVTKVCNTQHKITWAYINTKLNPADVASRGAYASELVGHQLWWQPSVLMCDESAWPRTEVTCTELPGLRKVLINVEVSDLDTTLQRFSTFDKLQRVTAYCLRFIDNCKKYPKRQGALTISELDRALLVWIKFIQKSELSELIVKIDGQQLIPKQFRSLSPFLDATGILRVGGRLNNSELNYGAKYPILMPKKSHLTYLLIDHHHRAFCHIGPRSLQAILFRQYWIVGARQVIRSRVHKCISCFKLRAPTHTPMMADLPEDRVRQARAFDGVGVDFGGPFTIRASNLRNGKKMKAYVCIFVCLSTKAVHLEVVSELSTQAFLLTFERFSSRRGIPSLVRSDCGTNFVGAAKYLTDMHRHIKNADVQGDIQRRVSRSGIRWLFNPPSSPNFGGIFEAAIKSAKQHLKRTVGEQILTFEELTTVFTRIEAVLNSRPLCPVSSSPNDLEVLTPGHFLIGQPLVAPPEQEYSSALKPLGIRFKMVQTIFQHFWKRWHVEYLHTLQHRPKWNQHTDPIQLGELVLIKDSPLLKWRTGRVQKLLPGKDGVVRVVEVKTASGALVRPTSKLCRFPPSEF